MKNTLALIVAVLLTLPSRAEDWLRLTVSSPDQNLRSLTMLVPLGAAGRPIELKAVTTIPFAQQVSLEKGPLPTPESYKVAPLEFGSVLKVVVIDDTQHDVKLVSLFWSETVLLQWDMAPKNGGVFAPTTRTYHASPVVPLPALGATAAVELPGDLLKRKITVAHIAKPTADDLAALSQTVGATFNEAHRAAILGKQK